MADVFLHADDRMNAVLHHAAGAIPVAHEMPRESFPVAKLRRDEIKSTIGR